MAAKLAAKYPELQQYRVLDELDMLDLRDPREFNLEAYLLLCVEGRRLSAAESVHLARAWLRSHPGDTSQIQKWWDGKMLEGSAEFGTLLASTPGLQSLAAVVFASVRAVSKLVTLLDSTGEMAELDAFLRANAQGWTGSKKEWLQLLKEVAASNDKNAVAVLSEMLVDPLESTCKEIQSSDVRTALSWCKRNNLIRDVPASAREVDLDTLVDVLQREPGIDLELRMYRLTSRSGHSMLFHDPSDIIGDIERWARESERLWRTAALHPLIVTGAIKSGKSTVLTRLWPAVVARYHDLSTDLKVLQLDLGDLLTSEGWQVMLSQLLDKITTWAAEAGVTSPALQRANMKLLQPSASRHVYPHDVTRIFAGMKDRVMVQIDEVQNLLIPMNPLTGSVDVHARKAAGLLIKDLMTHSSSSCMIGMTGSSMALFWSVLNETPSNGTVALLHGKVIRLPLLHEQRAMELVASDLQRNVAEEQAAEIAKGTPELLEMLENSAILTYCVQEFGAATQRSPFLTTSAGAQRSEPAGRPSSQPPQSSSTWAGSSTAFGVMNVETDLGLFTARVTALKLINEAATEWTALLSSRPKNERVALRALADMEVGCSPSVLGPGLEEMYKRLVMELETGHVYLSSFFARATLLAIVDSEGNLCQKSYDLAYYNAVLADAQVQIGMIGNKLNGIINGNGTWSEKTRALDDWLKVPADLVVKAQGPASSWNQQDWFRQAWFSRENQGSGHDVTAASCEDDITTGVAAQYKSRLGAADLSPQVQLAFYMIFLRNAASHRKAGIIPRGCLDVPAILRDSPAMRSYATFSARWQRFTRVQLPEQWIEQTRRGVSSSTSKDGAGAAVSQVPQATAATADPVLPTPAMAIPQLDIGKTGLDRSPSKLYVSGLPYDWPADQVKNLLLEVGTLRSFQLVVDKITNASKGYAFCTYSDEAATETAIKTLNGKKVAKRVLTVERARHGTRQGPARPDPASTISSRGQKPRSSSGSSGPGS